MVRVVPKIAGLDPLGGGLPLFTSCLEEAFSEIGLPVLSILGISVNKGTLPSSFRSLGAGLGCSVGVTPLFLGRTGVLLK